MYKYLYRMFIVLSMFLFISEASSQMGKIVVIPLAGDGPEQCVVSKECDAGKAALTCPSGDVEVACEAPKRVFVTSSQHNGNLGGLDGADAICQGHANEQGLNGVFRAWLSDDTETPYDRFIHSSTPYVQLDGTTVASSFEDLIDFNTHVTIRINELGLRTTGEVWSSTNIIFDSESQSSILSNISNRVSGNHCQNWGSDSESEFGGEGFVGVRVDQPYIIWTNAGIYPCSADDHRLLCFEQ